MEDLRGGTIGAASLTSSTITRSGVPNATNIEGMKHNLRAYAEQTGAKGAPSDVRKFLELSYLSEALTEIGKR